MKLRRRGRGSAFLVVQMKSFLSFFSSPKTDFFIPCSPSLSLLTSHLLCALLYDDRVGVYWCEKKENKQKKKEVCICILFAIAAANGTEECFPCLSPSPSALAAQYCPRDSFCHRAFTQKKAAGVHKNTAGALRFHLC